ncbi:virulence factor Mce family protein [Mycolicibacterium vaccae]|uniref:virulence factor Mce family protein n=1 Tax=Mycolicibacterium vaccae TaxID=1810 RepID=UPI003CF9CA39
MIARSVLAAGIVLPIVLGTGACGFRGVNSVPLPGTAGTGADSITIQAQMPDVNNIEQNSRVRVGDVNVGTVTRIERQDWHALVTMKLDRDVDLPANATVTIGQTSLLGSLHVELVPPVDAPPEGRLRDGAVIPLAQAGAYPTTEQTLGAVSMLLNGGGIGQLQDITEAFSTAFAGREDDLRSLIGQLDEFLGHLDEQSDQIIDATDGLNNLVQQVADQQPALERALTTIPDAIAVLRDQRLTLVEAVDKLGQFSAHAAESADRTRTALAQELRDIAPVLMALADSGPALTRSLSFLSTFPWVKEHVHKWFRGDYANITAVVDLTLSRLDAALLTGTRFEGSLTNLELQWGRTIGQLPSPYTAGNPLTVPYIADQGR